LLDKLGISLSSTKVLKKFSFRPLGLLVCSDFRSYQTQHTKTNLLIAEDLIKWSPLLVNLLYLAFSYEGFFCFALLSYIIAFSANNILMISLSLTDYIYPGKNFNWTFLTLTSWWCISSFFYV